MISAIKQTWLFFQLPTNSLRQIDGNFQFTIHGDKPCVVTTETLLGKGGFGMVFLAKQVYEGKERQVALKRFTFFNYFLYEVLMMKQIRETGGHYMSECIQASRGTFNPISNSFIFVDFEKKAQMIMLMRLESFSVENMLFNRHIPELLGVLLGVCIALKNLHKKGIIHQDIKPENIFLRLSGNSTHEAQIGKITDEEVKFISVLGDFGITCGLKDGCAASLAIGLSPPEMLRKRDRVWNSKATDIWCLGATIVRLVTRRLLFYAKPTEEELDQYSDYKTQMKSQIGNRNSSDFLDSLSWEEVSQSLGQLDGLLKGLLTRMLTKDPGERPQIDEILKVIITVIDDEANKGDKSYIKIKAAYNTQELIKRQDEESSPETFENVLGEAQKVPKGTKQSQDPVFSGAINKQWFQLGSDENVVMGVLQSLWNRKWDALLLYILWRILKGIFYMILWIFK